MTLASFDQAAGPDAVAAALKRDGAVVLRAQASERLADAVARLYLGSLWHGGGANRTDRPRMGLINTYALGWLRQEENQYLTIPRAIADSYPDRIRRLIGYQSHGSILGTYPDDPDGHWFTNTKSRR